MDNHIMIDTDILKNEQIDNNTLALYIRLVNLVDKQGVVVLSGEELMEVGKSKNLKSLLDRVDILESNKLLERSGTIDRKRAYKLNKEFYYKV